jgi:MraZ protein
MLIGEYQHTIDSKKRLALPAKFRKELGDTIVVTKGFENCLVVYTQKEWEITSGKIGGLPAEARGFVRMFLAGAMEVNTDKLGRILIPDYLKEYAGLRKNVVICGLFNKLEVWDKEKWDVYRKRVESEAGDFPNKLKELGI